MKRFSLLFLAIFSIQFFSVSAETVRKLSPPILTPSSTKCKIACTRPMREGKFNISVEDKNNKILVHCYGHGGSGCTTVFGSVDKAIKLFEAHSPNAEKKPIRVIGSGIMGLTAAIELTQRGYNVVGIVTKDLYDIPSWKNAGYFALVSVKTSKEEEENLNQIGMTTFKEFQKINKGEHPYISAGCVQMLPVYCSLDTEAGVENLEAAGLIPPKKIVTLDFGNGVRHKNFVEYMTYFMDTTQIMLELRAEVDRLQIPVELKEIQNFDDIVEPIVFNCSGIGAKTLNHDDQMVPVRGHLINLNAESGDGHMKYMIYTKVKGDNGEDEYVYMFPKCLQVTADCPKGQSVHATLGGTFIPITKPMTISEFDALDAYEFQKLIERNNQFFWGKKTLN